MLARRRKFVEHAILTMRVLISAIDDGWPMKQKEGLLAMAATTDVSTIGGMILFPCWSFWIQSFTLSIIEGNMAWAWLWQSMQA